MRKVMVFGTFDILHKGHEYLLKEAKKYGDYLVVLIARDKTILKIKKRKPIYNEKNRLKNLKKLKSVDKVILGDIEDKYKKIEIEKPDVICLGYDQKAFTKNLKKELTKKNLFPKIIRLKSFHPEKYKSSILRLKRK